jgi:hypothetical protein
MVLRAVPKAVHAEPVELRAAFTVDALCASFASDKFRKNGERHD